MAERSLPSRPRLLISEIRLQVRLLFRNPLSILFTIVLPLLLLPLLDALNSTRIRIPGSRLEATPDGLASAGIDAFGFGPYMQYATPAVAAFAVTAACFANLGIRTAVAREYGVLKRVRGTPLPPGVHLAGRVVANIVVAVLVVAASLALGLVLFDFDMGTDHLLAVLVVIGLGAATFSALGLAGTALVPNADAAPAIVYALLFPLAFLSNVFFAPELAPDWMQTSAAWLPLEPFVTSMVRATNPAAPGWGPLAEDLVALGAWGVGGGLVAVATFRWVPNRERTVVTTRRAVGGIRVLTIPIAAAIVAVGVFAWDAGDDHRFYELGAADEIGDQLPYTTVLRVEVDDLPEQIGFGVGFGPSGGEVPTTPITATVVDDGPDGPVVLLGGECGLLAIGSVDPAWLGAVAPDRTGGALVDPCSGGVLERDGTCVGGACSALAWVRAERRGDVFGVRPGAARPTSPPDPDAPASPVPSAALVYSGSGTLTTAAGTASLSSPFVLVDQGGGFSILGSGSAFRVDLETTERFGGALRGVSVTGPDASDGLGVFVDRPLPWLAAEPGSDHVGDTSSGVVRSAVDGDGTRTVTVADPPASITWRSSGPPRAWSSLRLEVTSGDASLRLDLQR